MLAKRYGIRSSRSFLSCPLPVFISHLLSTISSTLSTSHSLDFELSPSRSFSALSSRPYSFDLALRPHIRSNYSTAAMSTQQSHGKTSFLIMSDTHNLELASVSPDDCPLANRLPKVDVLLHCGDLTQVGGLSAYKKVLRLISSYDAEVSISLSHWANR